MSEVTTGLEIGVDSGPVDSIGIDTWGVDYGLLDSSGQLISLPYSYRDKRTATWEEIADRIGRKRLYAISGIQLMPINSIFQLALHDRGELERATRLLMLPELVVHGLSGSALGERTSAGTTGLVDCRTGDWSDDLLNAIEIERGLMPEISPAGTSAGEWRTVPIYLVGGHDTASAVVGLTHEATAGRAFISSGTWMLVGTTRREPDTSDAAFAANFTNEPGALGGVRFLKNVMGLWLLERCLDTWPGASLYELALEAAELPAGGPQIDATDERFLTPADMDVEIRSSAGIPASAGRAVVVRCILDSLAAAAAKVTQELEELTQETITQIEIVGGGSRNTLLNTLIAEATGARIVIGAGEATALGNAMVQARAVHADIN